MSPLLDTLNPPLLAAIDFGSLTPFLWGALLLAVGMLLWDTIEVGRNDAANLVNAVFGARILTPRTAAYVAAAGVILGALSSEPVMETARKGIFSPEAVAAVGGVQAVLAVYVSVYVVDTVMLYTFSAFGMPVSTTACLVFSLLGGAFAVGGFGVVNWGKAGTVVFAIVCSIFVSGAAAFMIQRAVRGAVRDRTASLSVMLAHGSWTGGAMLTGLCYFMLVKGMKHVGWVKWFNHEVVQRYEYGPILTVIGLWTVFAILIHTLLVIFGRRAARRLYPTLAIIGTFAMAVAFGQNDLANCASPGLAATKLISDWDAGVPADVDDAKIKISVWALAGCGLLMAGGLLTRNAQRVTRAAASAGSMSHNVRLWAPGFCLAAARYLLKFRGAQPTLAPPAALSDAGKKMHYDSLRACVILTVSASVIATCSGLGLPVSTTYVSFAAIVATGMADRILQRGDADLKLARTIWVIFSWFGAAAISAVAAGVVAAAIYRFELVGMVVAVAVNLIVRTFVKRRADTQEEHIRQAAEERLHPEQYADEYEG